MLTFPSKMPLRYPLLLAVASCAATAAPPESEAPKAEPTVTTAPPLVQAGGPTSRPPPPEARVVPIPASCRGDHLSLDGELTACACSDAHYVQVDGKVSVRTGAWCGLPHPNEAAPVNVEVTAERPVVAAGERTTALVRVANPGGETAVVRVANRHLAWGTKIVQENGQWLPETTLSSGPANDEALVELLPHATVEIRIPVTVPRLAPGRYAIRVPLNGLGGEAFRLVPVQVR